jgi:hypothetical protein
MEDHTMEATQAVLQVGLFEFLTSLYFTSSIDFALSLLYLRCPFLPLTQELPLFLDQSAEIVRNICRGDD